MRLFLSTLLAALIVPLAAHAQAPKQVEVINDPLAVEVVNPAPPSPPVRWQLVGFTAATMVGTVGPLEIARVCAAEFAGSRTCTSAEILDTTDPPVVNGEAWVRPAFLFGLGTTPLDASGVREHYLDYSCNSGAFALRVDAAGGFRTAPCSEPRAVACCALVP